MKSIFLISCLFPLFLSAQEGKVLTETDPYTKETKISSGFISLQGGASVSVEADSKELDFFFIINGKCFNDASTAVVYFDSSRLKTTYRNSGSMNCTGYFHFKFRNGTVTPTQVQKLGTMKVSQFVFVDSDKKQVTISFTPEQQKVFMESAACVTAEAKKLIKQ
jgi:hypothetical protein